MDTGTVTVLWIVSAIMIIAALALTLTFMQRNASTESKHFSVRQCAEKAFQPLNTLSPHALLTFFDFYQCF